MERILLQRWFQVTVGGIVAVVLGLLIWLLVLGGPLAPTERPDRVVLHCGSPTLTAPLPLMAREAAEAGWTEPAGKCISDQGRFFHKEGEPYVLIYNIEDSLIGMYLYTDKEMPSPPWRFFEVGTEVTYSSGGGSYYFFPKYPDLGLDHWGLSVYFKEPTRPCVPSGAVKGTVGRRPSVP